MDNTNVNYFHTNNLNMNTSNTNIYDLSGLNNSVHLNQVYPMNSHVAQDIEQQHQRNGQYPGEPQVSHTQYPGQSMDPRFAQNVSERQTGRSHYQGGPLVQKMSYLGQPMDPQLPQIANQQNQVHNPCQGRHPTQQVYAFGHMKQTPTPVNTGHSLPNGLHAYPSAPQISLDMRLWLHQQNPEPRPPVFDDPPHYKQQYHGKLRKWREMDARLRQQWEQQALPRRKQELATMQQREIARHAGQEQLMRAQEEQRQRRVIDFQQQQAAAQYVTPTNSGSSDLIPTNEFEPTIGHVPVSDPVLHSEVDSLLHQLRYATQESTLPPNSWQNAVEPQTTAHQNQNWAPLFPPPQEGFWAPDGLWRTVLGVASTEEELFRLDRNGAPHHIVAAVMAKHAAIIDAGGVWIAPIETNASTVPVSQGLEVPGNLTELLDSTEGQYNTATTAEMEALAAVPAGNTTAEFPEVLTASSSSFNLGEDATFESEPNATYGAVDSASLLQAVAQWNATQTDVAVPTTTIPSAPEEPGSYEFFPGLDQEAGLPTTVPAEPETTAELPQHGGLEPQHPAGGTPVGSKPTGVTKRPRGRPPGSKNRKRGKKAGKAGGNGSKEEV